MITRRVFLQLASAFPFLRPPKLPRCECTGLAFPLYFPDGLDGNGEDMRVFLPWIGR